MNRTFTTASVVSLPTRRTTPSWITRSSLAWIGFDMSTSSSSSNVPPFAASSRPGLSRTAPVKAPLQWPNISDSSNGSGSAAQFTATSERLERRLLSWMNRSEEHTSELQPQSHISYAVFCLKKKTKQAKKQKITPTSNTNITNNQI